MIPKEQWRWFGYPAHFIGASDCRFHLVTVIGDHVVSTVGDYHPRSSDKRDRIGWNRYFETMVFSVDHSNPCVEADCGCGMPAITDYCERESDGYETAGEASVGHMAMCERWAAGGGQ